MIRTLTIKNRITAFLCFLFAAILSGVLLSASLSGFIDAVKGPVALTGEVDPEELEGAYVSWEVKYPLEQYMETTRSKKVNGVSTGAKTYRVSYAAIDDEHGIFLGVEVPVNKSEQMNALADRFWNAVDGEEMPEDRKGLPVKGTLERLDGEELQYFKQLMAYMDVAVEEPVYQITDGKIQGEEISTVYCLVGIGLISLLIGLAILVRSFTHSVKKEVNAYLEANPEIRLEDMDQDFSQAEKVGKCRIGRKWTFCHSMNHYFAENRSIIWVHFFTKSSRRSVTTYLVLELLDGQSEQIAMSEKKCKQIMEIYSRFPHIVVGNSPDHAYLLKNDREEFLNRKYRPNIDQM